MSEYLLSLILLRYYTTNTVTTRLWLEYLDITYARSFLSTTSTLRTWFKPSPFQLPSVSCSSSRLSVSEGALWVEAITGF